MTGYGHQLPLGADAERVRCAPISGPYLKWWRRPSRARERTGLRGSALRAKPYGEKGAWRRERDDADAQIAVRIGASGHPLNDEGINTLSRVTIEAMTICKIVMIQDRNDYPARCIHRREFRDWTDAPSSDVHFETVSIGQGRDLSSGHA